jgi:hypothetical protein
MPNSINSLSPDFRDFLLNKNLITDTITENGLVGLLVGIGEPKTSIGTPPESIQPSPNILDNGILYKDLNIVTNKFQGTDNDYQQIDITYNSSLPSTSAFIYSSNYIVDNGILKDTIDLPPTRDFSTGGDIRQFNTSLNLYDDPDNRTLIDLNYLPSANVKYTNYLDLNSNIINNEIDVLGTIFNGQGIGIGGNGIESNFDLRATLLGRTLGGTGVISDTPLGQAGAKYLGLALANNLSFGLQQETVGHLNLNPLNLAMNGLDSFVVPTYDITVPQGKLGKALDFGARVLGFEVPFSQFDRSSSIFASENPVSNIDRANAQLSNSGKGQVLSLFSNIKQNKYQPAFQDDRVKGGNNASEADKTQKGIANNPEIYAFGTSEGGIIDFLNKSEGNVNDSNTPISQSNYKLSGLIDDSGFGESLNGESEYGEDGTHVTQYIWGDDNPANLPGKRIFGGSSKFNDSKTLLGKTKTLFASNKMRTIVSGKASTALPSEIQSAVHGVEAGGSGTISKGSGVLSQRALDGDFSVVEDVYCRTWTTFDRYNQVFDLQKHSGVNGTTAFREGLEESVLGPNGFVKVGAYIGDDVGNEVAPANIKNFMFSIENLAWADGDSIANLLPCEIGPGDPMTGRRGRIMWFPPYDINITENISANWESTNFIGRGEPVYTYNNTERTGTLQFKIVVDHPSYLNAIRSESDEYIASFFAGCTDIDPILAQKLTTIEKNEIQTRNTQAPQQKESDPTDPKIPRFSFYFANDVATLNEDYENQKDGGGLGFTQATGEFVGSKRLYVDDTDFGLNGDQSPGILQQYGGWISSEGKDVIRKILNEECRACRVEIFGYASIAGGTTGNAAKNQQKLSDARAESVKTWFKDNIFSEDTTNLYGTGEGQITQDERFVKVDGKGTDNGGEPCILEKGVDTSAYFGCKYHRKTTVQLSFDPELDAKINKREVEPKEIPEEFRVNSKIINRFYNECNYFEMLKQEDNFVYDSLKKKLKFFHPAFHAITPEGLNSRLTFLHQCTRQGPTNIVGTSTNLAFGRPPVCILRLGDFYYTKIIIDNIGISYEPLVWDLNPEGIGVQPMIATVDLSFKIIGGQSLKGPINKLQNAVSFNFFGNTQVYDVRADKIAKSDNIPADKNIDNLAKSVNGDYVIIPGTTVLKSIIEVTEESLKPTASNLDIMANNQEVVAEASATAQEGSETSSSGTTATTIDNNSVIQKIGLGIGQYEVVDDELIILGFTYFQTGNLPFALNSSGDKFTGKVYIKTSGTTQYYLGDVNVTYNDANSVLITTNLDNIVLNSAESVFQIQIDFSDKLTVGEYTSIKEMKQLTLSVEWDNKSKSKNKLNFIG